MKRTVRFRLLWPSLLLFLVNGPAQAQGFFGTTTLLPFEISVSNERVVRLEPGTATDGPNVIMGWSGNSVAAGVFGATICGGGSPSFENRNRVEAKYGTVCGGHGNTANAYSSTVSGGQSNMANGIWSTVPGGVLNSAHGDYSFAAGYVAKARHEGSFIWADRSFSLIADSFYTTANNQFLIRANGGVGIGTKTPESTMEINMPFGTTDDDYGLLLNAGDRRWNLIIGGAHAGNAAFLQLLYKNHDETTYTPRFTFTHTGRLGINNTNPQHLIEVGTFGNPLNGNGAHVTAGGVWTNGSSRHFKEGFQAVDVEAVLEQLAGLSITRWRYKGDGDSEHLGPVAEDFFGAFGLGEDARYIGTVDADGVALAAIQGLYARNRALREQSHRQQAAIKALEAELAAQREAAAAVEARLARLEAALGQGVSQPGASSRGVNR